MTRQYIAETIWHDPEVKNYFMLDVTNTIPAQIPKSFEGIELLPKDEYHCTLVAPNKITDSLDDQAEIERSVTAYFMANPDAVQFDGLTDRLYVCREDGEMTLVAEARILGLDGLRRCIQSIVPEYKAILPHVTLLKSQNSPYGIGIHSADDLANLCVQIDPTELE